MSLSLQRGVFSTCVGLVGTGAIMIWPEMWIIGVVLIVVAAVIFLGGIEVHGRPWWLKDARETPPSGNSISRPMGDTYNLNPRDNATAIGRIDNYHAAQKPYELTQAEIDRAVAAAKQGGDVRIISVAGGESDRMAERIIRALNRVGIVPSAWDKSGEIIMPGSEEGLRIRAHPGGVNIIIDARKGGYDNASE